MSDPKASTSLTNPPEANRVGHEMELHWWRWTLLIAGIVATISLFYTEENWRGQRAWKQCKRALEAQGQKLDWSLFVPPPAPDGENFFTAPSMAAWFVKGGGSYLSGRLSSGRDDFLWQRDSNPVVELSVFPREGPVNLEGADLVLDLQDAVLTIAARDEKPRRAAEPAVVPLIVFSNAPLVDVIRNLARLDNLRFSLDPRVGFRESDPQPAISGSWSNVTAHATLIEILSDNRLALVPELKTGVGRIVRKDPSDKGVYLPPEVARQMSVLIQNTVAARTNGVEEPTANAPQRFTTFFRSLVKARPARIMVRTDKAPDAQEVEELFPKKVVSCFSGSSRAHAESVETNSFRIWISQLPCTAAADYLAWSDQFDSDFDLIREAAKRPYARMYGNYEDPLSVPIPNFVSLRLVAQTLAQRAQCHLLLGQPDDALRESSLNHDLCRILEARPSGKPMTLVAAMIQVAITRLYVGVIADGLRLQAWHEPQLAAIQGELGKVNLLPFVSRAFDTERASLCQVLERITPDRCSQMFYGSSSTGLGSQLQDPVFLFLTFAPRGWIYYNMVTTATRQKIAMDAFDLTQTVVWPVRVEVLNQAYSAHEGRFWPRTFLADNLSPNFVRAIQETARTQTLVNEALLACALERYRLAYGSYPERIEMLSPGLLQSIPADVIGGHPMKYHPTEKDRFTLYSIGWNEKDDGGVPGSKDVNRFDIDKGDWVWPYREKLIK